MLAKGIILSTLLVGAACGRAAPAPSNPTFASLLAERKFEPGACYAGADNPEDRPALEAAVDDAVRDIASMPSPMDARAVRERLERLIRDVDGFATEDRDQSYRYAIRIWRAAGQQGESHLFALDDAHILAQPC